MITFLAIIHIVACLGLVGLVLIQDSKGGGVFTSQASSNSVLGATGATTLAQTMTKIIATIFALTCISLSIMSARSQKSVVDSGALSAAAAVPTQAAPAAATQPAAAATQTTTTVPATTTPPAEPAK